MQGKLTPGCLVTSCRSDATLWAVTATTLYSHRGRRIAFPSGATAMFVRYADFFPSERDNPPISVIFYEESLWFVTSDSLKSYT